MTRLRGRGSEEHAQRLQQRLDRIVENTFGEGGLVKDLFARMRDVNLRGTSEGRVIECKYYLGPEPSAQNIDDARDTMAELWGEKTILKVEPVYEDPRGLDTISSLEKKIVLANNVLR